MKLSVIILISIFSQLATADCESLFNEKLKELDLGKIGQVPADVNSEDNEQKIFFTRSKRLGRKDTGPTVIYYKDKIAIKQTLPKNESIDHRQQYYFVMEPGCNKYKSVRYTSVPEQADLTSEACQDISKNFEKGSIDNMSIEQMCEKYFPNKSNEIFKIEKSKDKNSGAVKS